MTKRSHFTLSAFVFPAEAGIHHAYPESWLPFDRLRVTVIVRWVCVKMDSKTSLERQKEKARQWRAFCKNTLKNSIGCSFKCYGIRKSGERGSSTAVLMLTSAISVASIDCTTLSKPIPQPDDWPVPCSSTSKYHSNCLGSTLRSIK